MATLRSLALAGLASVAAAKQCMNVTVPVQIMARNGIFNLPSIMTNEDAATFTANYTSIAGGTNFTEQVTTGYATITGQYDISAKFCTPDSGMGANPVVQVLSHGIGFDKTYWDLPYNNFNYSYIDVLVDQHGYCTLSYDRFGIGNSSHADPYAVVQAAAEVSALYQLSSMLREGSFPGVNHAFSGNSKIVHVGHSYGSQQSYMLTAMYPAISDGIVLTGFSFNGSFTNAVVASFVSKIARQNQPLRFGSTNAGIAVSTITAAAAQYNITLSEVYQALNAFNLTPSEITDIVQSTAIWDLIAGSTQSPPPIPQNLPDGYLTWVDAGSNQYNFLYPTGFDPQILYYAEANKQPYTVGEILTLGGAPAPSPFTGPVQILTGREDAIYCGGDCLSTGNSSLASIPAAAAIYFGSSSNFSTYIQPNAGHALNLHYVAVDTYNEIASFLSANNIVPS